MARTLTLVFAASAMLVALLCCLRLGAVVAATPSSGWLSDLGSVVVPSGPIDEGMGGRAAALSKLVAEPSLVPVMLAGCSERPTREGSSFVTVLEPAFRCDTALAYGLAALPISGELWLAVATNAMTNGRFDTSLTEALMNSFRAAPHEGWIAASRVILGLRLYPFLPDELQDNTKSDLMLVLGDERLMAPLVQAFLGDAQVRKIATDLLSVAPPDRAHAFVDAVRRPNTRSGR